MEYSTSLDWFTITNKYENLGVKEAPERRSDADRIYRKVRQNLATVSDYAIIPDDMKTDAEPTINRFYLFNWFTNEGLTVSLGTKTLQGVKVSLSGKFLDNRKDILKELYEGISGSTWKTTRADFAFDFFDSGTNTETIWKRYIEPAFIGKKLKLAFFQGKTGSTIYIGSRQSNYMVRIYDKGREQKTSHDWIRFELEIKKDGTNSLIGNYANDIRASASKIMGMCRNLPDSFIDVFKAISAGKTFGTIYNPELRTDREKYIHTFIAPYLESAIDTDKEAVRQMLFTIHKAWVEKTGENLF